MQHRQAKAGSVLHVILLLALGLAMGLVPSAWAQTIEGTVVDEDGKPLAGVTVFLDGTTHGDITDGQGRFSIEAHQAGGYLLVGRHLGYKTTEQDVVLRGDETLVLGALVMQEDVIALQEVVVEAMRPKRWRRHLRIFEDDLLGRTTVARHARLTNPEVLSFEPTESGFRAEASAPLVVENPKTGYRIRVFMERYEHHTRTGGYRFARRLLFEEMGEPSAAQRKLRGRLYRGSMGHFLWAWYHGRTHEEGFYVYGKLEEPRFRGDVAHAERREAILVEYAARPDRAYWALLRRGGAEPPFSSGRQVSRIAFPGGILRVAANGYALGPVRQEGYWAFAGVGDAVPAPAAARATRSARATEAK